MNVDENSYGVLGTISATDPEGDFLTYQITAGDTDFAFEVDSNGDLIVYGYLDFETTSSYQLTVEASDEFSSAYATVNITVNDVPEAPVFDPDTYSVTVAEDTYGTILQLFATDPQGEPLTYTITGGDTDSVFSIDSDGNLEVFGSLDYETTTSYQLTVEVSDGTETATATVDITVTDVVENAAPVISDFVASNYEGNSWVFTGTVVDEYPEGLYVDFGGVLDGYSIYVEADGSFTFYIELPPDTDSIVTAVTTDLEGLTSNTAQYWVISA